MTKVIPIVPEHTRLSPSASHRWLNCAGSVAANEHATRKANKHAEMGTAAAALLEMCLRLDVPPDTYLGKKLYKDFVVDDDGCRNVQIALDFIHSYTTKNHESVVKPEERVNIGPAINRNDCSGTPDVDIDNYPTELVILDYKNGFRNVEVDSNTQVMLYAVGKVVETKRTYKRYRFVIVQPRARHEDGPVREWTCTHKQLVEFVKHARERAALTDDKDAARTAGDWCKWCAVEGRCITLRDHKYEMAGMQFAKAGPPLSTKEMSDKALALVLKDAPAFESWIKAVYAESEARMLKAKDLPGWKLVLGRTQRYVANEVRAKTKLLSLGYKEDEFAPRKFGGIGLLETLLKKRKLDFDKTFKGMINRTKPVLHVAPADDPRPKYQRGQEFKEKE